jgi:outer membrane protein assembly factor BamB
VTPGLSARGVLALGALIMVALLVGCRGKGVKPSPLPDFEPRHDVRVIWRNSAGISKRYIFSPVYVGNAVCAAGYAGRLSCFDSRNGQRIWASSAGVAFSGGVGIVENMILAGSTKGEVLAFATNGTLLWRTQLTSEILSAPAGSGPMVIVRTGDSKLVGLDARDGRQIWMHQSPEQSLTLRANPGLAIVDETTLISGWPGGRLAKLDMADGGLLWEISVATPRGDNELERITDIAGTPLVEDGRVYAVTYQGRIGCFDTEKGTQIWARDASSAGSISADSKSVYYTEADGVVVALDKGSGASVWRQEKLLHRRVSSPIVIGDWVVVGDYQGYVHVMSRDDGSFVARVGTDGSNIVAAPVRMDEKVLLLTQSGGLYAIAFGG